MDCGLLGDLSPKVHNTKHILGSSKMLWKCKLLRNYYLDGSIWPKFCYFVSTFQMLCTLFGGGSILLKKSVNRKGTAQYILHKMNRSHILNQNVSRSLETPWGVTKSPQVQPLCNVILFSFELHINGITWFVLLCLASVCSVLSEIHPCCGRLGVQRALFCVSTLLCIHPSCCGSGSCGWGNAF